MSGISQQWRKVVISGGANYVAEKKIFYGKKLNTMEDSLNEGALAPSPLSSAYGISLLLHESKAKSWPSVNNKNIQ